MKADQGFHDLEKEIESFYTGLQVETVIRSVKNLKKEGILYIHGHKINR